MNSKDGQVYSVSTTVCSQNMNIANETLTDYSFPY